MNRLTRRSAILASLLSFASAGAALAQPDADEASAPDAPAAPAPAEPAATAPAEPAPAEPAPATPAATPSWADLVTVSGLTDAYFSAPLAGGFRAPSPVRVFDGASGTFALAYTELAVAMAPAPAGFRIDLGFGPVADATSLEVTSVGDPAVTVTGASEALKHLQQAYASVKLPGATSIIVDAGKFVTSTGAELIEAKDNWLYSRSILFGWAIPFSHTGVRVNATLSDQLAVQAMVVNGWDVVADNNKAKTFGGSVIYTGQGGGLVAALNLLGGVEVTDVRLLVDAVVTKKLGDKLALNLNADFGKDGDATWYGAAAMVRAQVSPHLNVVGRVEHFRDPDGGRLGVADVAVSEVTAGVGVPVGHSAEFRFEGRVDLASKELFDGGTSKTQPTLQGRGARLVLTMTEGQRTIAVLECVVGMAAVGIPRDRVKQLIEYDLTPVPSPARYIGGLGVHGEALIVSVALSPALGTARRRARGVLLDAPGGAWVVEVSRVDAFAQATLGERGDGSGQPAWIRRAGTATHRAMVAIDVDRMIAALSAGGAAVMDADHAAIVVAAHRLDDGAQAQVIAACDRLGARHVTWHGDRELDEPPAVVVAGLGPGKRRVPADLMELCTHRYPGTRLLLLCQESLVQPTVALEDGQIVLIGPPLTPDRIHGRLALLRAERAADEAPSTISAIEDPAEPVWCRERMYRDIWVAGLGCHGRRGGPGNRPLLTHTRDGVTALVPNRAGQPFDELEVRTVLEVLRAPPGARPTDADLARACRTLRAVHFDRRVEEWVVCWPGGDAPLTLRSDQRLPPRWDLRRNGEVAPVFRVKAYPGDVVIGQSVSFGDSGVDATEPGDRATGGPAVLAALEHRLLEMPQPFVGVVLEVRA